MRRGLSPHSGGDFDVNDAPITLASDVEPASITGSTPRTVSAAGWATWRV